MLKLNYRATFTFTSQDIGDVADNEPIIYEVWANRPEGWTAKCRDFFQGEAQEVGLALDIVGLSLVSVAQGGERWPLEGRAGAEALRQSVEEQNPGYGDHYIRQLAFAVFDQVVKREDDRLGNSGGPSTASANGSVPEKSTSGAATA